jgi:hypothetical protein
MYVCMYVCVCMFLCAKILLLSSSSPFFGHMDDVALKDELSLALGVSTSKLVTICYTS